jgi:hypothetical protein
MAHVSQQQELLTDAGPDLCRDAVTRALEGMHAKPLAEGSTITGQVGSYGMYDFHGRKHPEELPVSIAVTIDDVGPQRRLRIVAESHWPFDEIEDWMAADYQDRCQQLVTALKDSTAAAITPVGVG